MFRYLPTTEAFSRRQDLCGRAGGVESRPATSRFSKCEARTCHWPVHHPHPPPFTLRHQCHPEAARHVNSHRVISHHACHHPRPRPSITCLGGGMTLHPVAVVAAYILPDTKRWIAMTPLPSSIAWDNGIIPCILFSYLWNGCQPRDLKDSTHQPRSCQLPTDCFLVLYTS